MKDSFRDRRTLLLTVFLPIIMMTGLAFFYEYLLSSNGEKSTYTLVVNSSISEEEEILFNNLTNVTLYKSDDPKKELQEGIGDAAVIFSDNFAKKIEKGEKGKVTIIGDSYGQNSSHLMSLVATQLTSYEKEVISQRLKKLGTDENIIQPFTLEQIEFSDETPSTTLLGLLVPLILSLAIGIGASPAASDLFAGEKERKTMESLLMTPVNRSTMLFAKWLTISSIGSIIGLVTLMVVTLEIKFFTKHLKEAITFGDQWMVIVALALLISISYSMLIASILMLTSIIGKSIKEAQSYSTLIMMLCLFPAMIITTIGVNELKLYHFSIPLFNFFSISKELLLGIVDVKHIIIVLISNTITMLILFIIGRILFLKDKWVMNV